MFVKINKPSGGDNKGSSVKMANYLDKDKETSYFDKGNNFIAKENVISELDGNHKNLGKNDDKFYMLSINPSKDELKHLIGREIGSYEELSTQEKEKLFKNLQGYTHDVMDKYAENFNRDTVKSSKDLVYFSKIETSREYKHYDKEVKEGTAKKGEKKLGLNVHIHVVVSRNNVAQNTKLSPNGRFRGSEWEREGSKVSRGFNHENFKVQSIEKFNAKFNYKPKEKDTYKGNGTSQSSSGKNLVTQTIKGQAKSKVINKVKQNILQGNFREEQKLIGQGKQVISAVKNPKSIIKKQVIKAIKGIISPEKHM